MSITTDTEIIRLRERAAGAEAELAKRFPDIGPDPLNLDGDEREKRGDISQILKILNEARSVQQSGVPCQTALVWRIDLSRLMDDHTVLAARWRDLKPALEQAEAALQLNTFGGGVVSMARNCQAAIDLVHRGTWTLDKMNSWLVAVIANDAKFLSEVKPELEAVVNDSKE